MKSQTQKIQGINFLQLQTSKGFSFNIPNSVILTQYPYTGIIFFLECSVRFYDGNTYRDLYRTENPISMIDLRGNQLAIGEKMLKGQLTTTTVYNLQNQQAIKFRYQKTKVECLSLSCGCEYLCSVGSSDTNKQQLLIINVKQKLEFGFKTLIKQEFTLKKGQRIIQCVFSTLNPYLLVILYEYKFTFLIIEQNKIIERVVKSYISAPYTMVLFTPNDKLCYASIKGGRISQIDVQHLSEKRMGPKKRSFLSNIKYIRFVLENHLILIGQKGFIGLAELGEIKVIKEVTLKQQIISITEFKGELGFVATDKAAIYILNASNLTIKQFYACHSSRVNQVCFMEGYSQVFASCAGSEIIVWKNLTLTPIMKISLMGSLCMSLQLLRDGSAIVSGWSDECIRFYNSKTGKKINQINNAHSGKVTALTSNKLSKRLYSGGEDGKIKVWQLQNDKFGIVESIFSGHRTQVHFLFLCESQLYSCSEDGSFAMWDIVRGQKLVLVAVQGANFLRKVVPIDEYSLYAIGSGSNFVTVSKNNGKIISGLEVGGSFLNDFDLYDLRKQEKMVEINRFFIFGGDSHSLVIKYCSSKKIGEQKIGTQQYSVEGEISCIKFSPDHKSVIVATVDGTLLCYNFNSKGFAQKILDD